MLSLAFSSFKCAHCALSKQMLRNRKTLKQEQIFTLGRHRLRVCVFSTVWFLHSCERENAHRIRRLFFYGGFLNLKAGHWWTAWMSVEQGRMKSCSTPEHYSVRAYNLLLYSVCTAINGIMLFIHRARTHAFRITFGIICRIYFHHWQCNDFSWSPR